MRCFAVLFILAATAAAQQAPSSTQVPVIATAPEKTVVTTPGSTDAVIFNPGMGLAFCHFSCPKDWAYGKPMWLDAISNHVYIRVLWKTLHPAPGEFSIDESKLGQYITELKKTGKRFSFRIMPTCGSTPVRDIAPPWIFDIKGVKFVPYSPAEQRFPVVWQKEYLDAMEEIVAELARRYDGDPQLEFVDVPIGSYGELWFFGDEAEWRKLGFSADRAISATKDLIDLYRRHFKRTRLALPIGGGNFEWPGWDSESSNQRRVFNQAIQYCRRVGVMVRSDGFRVEEKYIEEKFPPLAPIVPTIGEPIGSFLGPDKQMTPSAKVYECALAARLSYFCWYGELSKVTGAERDLITDFARKLGYRFTVAQVEHPSTLKTGKLRHGILSAEVTWRNEGVAFCHQEIQLRSALLDVSGKVLVEKRQWPIHPIQTWTPDESVVEPIELKVPEGFSGKATLAVGMVTRAGRQINLALKENLPNHLYPIATVEVRKSDYAGDPIIFLQSNTPADWSVTGDVKATVVPRGGPTEKSFLRIGGPSLNESWVFAYGKRMPALPGAKYRFTGSIRVESLTTDRVPYLKFAFLDAKMKQIDLATAGRSRWRRVSGNRFPTKGLPWEEFNVTAIAPPGTVYTQIAVEKGTPQPAEAVVGLQGLRVELLEAP